MKVAIVAFTKRGCMLAHHLEMFFLEANIEVIAYGVEKYASESNLHLLDGSLREWTKKMFQEKQMLVFIGATGIAIRSIAPFIKDKTCDPAVVVIDEKASFVISLLSGHIGGANEWTNQLAQYLHAIPVITTATDLNGVFSVDVFAKKNGLWICNMSYAKEVASVLLEGGKVGFISDVIIEGIMPNGICFYKENITDVKAIEKIGIYLVGFDQSLQKMKWKPFEKTLYLLPKCYTLGIGCRKNTPLKQIEKVVEEALIKNQINWKQVELIASIDLKKEEVGLLEFSQLHQVEFCTFSAKELQELEGEYTASNFVKSITGISNVCERSAVLGSKNGSLIQKKIAKDGVTVAIAKRNWSVKFYE